MLRSERGMSRLELVITISAIMLILACTILLSIGEDGFSFLPEKEETVNNVNEEVENNESNVTNEANEINETVEKNEIVPAENKIANEINNIVDNTVYQGE